MAAELQADDREGLLYTGRDFRAFVSGRKVRYVERFSLQRHFGEVWDERADAAECREAELVPAGSSPVWLERRAPYPDYHTVMTGEAIRHGVLRENTGRKVPLNRYSSKPDGSFPEEEIPYKPYRWIQSFDQCLTGGAVKLPARNGAGE